MIILNDLLRLVLHILAAIFLTALTQIGGVVYALVLLLTRNIQSKRLIKAIGIFIVLYGLFTFAIVPATAPLFGREAIRSTDSVKAHHIMYILLNRNYVKPELNDIVERLGNNLDIRHSGIKLIYLDACFPFFDGFPLLPHLSHDDGKKLDITFVYENKDGVTTNLKRSRSGYGIFEEPIRGEWNQCAACKDKGFKQYDMAKYIMLGENNESEGLTMDEQVTRELVRFIVAEDAIGKVFIEPHLKTRLGLTHPKIRFHGCQAVRHDDHIHLQIK